MRQGKPHCYHPSYSCCFCSLETPYCPSSAWTSSHSPLACEMVLDIEIFKYQGPGGSATVVPIIFPLIAGAGALTTVLSLRAEYHVENIIVAILLNMVIVYFVLRYLNIAERILGKGGVYILRKFFGIILLAIAVKLFTANIASLF